MLVRLLGSLMLAGLAAAAAAPAALAQTQTPFRPVAVVNDSDGRPASSM